MAARWSTLIAAALMVAAAAPGTATTIQQDFDTATSAYDAKKWDDALKAYGELEQRIGTSSSRSLAIIQLRKGLVLHHLRRDEEAAEYLLRSMAKVPSTEPSLAADRFSAFFALGQIRSEQFDYTGAIDAYTQAAAQLPDPDSRVAAISSRAKLETVLDPQRAVADVDAALALGSTAFAKNKAALGQLRTIRGRALLNNRDYAQARQELDQAVSLLGGLTVRVSMTDIAARSDLAIASLLLGDQESAKKYLAYSGSGNLDDGFQRGADMNPPECGEETGLRPDDVAVIEFGINADGTIAYAMPVYVSRPGPANIAFARAVSQWSWSPEKLAKIPPLFRLMTRIQLRCSTSEQRPAVESVLFHEGLRWFESQHAISLQRTGIYAADLAAEQARLAQTVNAMERAALLFIIAANPAGSDAERAKARSEWTKLVMAADPPPMIRAIAGMTQADDTARGDLRRAATARLSLLDDPAIGADSHATNAIRLATADIYMNLRDFAKATPLVQAVISDARLSPTDSMRVAALTRRSSLALAAGDMGEARRSYEATGLTDAQCALIDVEPVRVKGRGSVDDYPAAAIEWRLSGWAVTEFDITADGTTKNIRTIVAYPPFVFDKPTEKIAARSRYTQTYRPESGLGCGGYHSSQSYSVIN